MKKFVLMGAAGLAVFASTAFAEMIANPQIAPDVVLVSDTHVDDDGVILAAVAMDSMFCASATDLSLDDVELPTHAIAVEASAWPKTGESVVDETVLVYHSPGDINDDDVKTAWTEAGETSVLTAFLTTPREATDQKMTLGGQRTVALIIAPLASPSGPLSTATTQAQTAGGVKVTDQAFDATV